MTKVFVSVGTPANDTQKRFRDEVVNRIRLVGLSPRVMEPDDWDYKNPLRGVRRCMDECHGAVVIAYARYQFPSGVELRKPTNIDLDQVEFPTAWNHIEAAMAYEKQLPLLVVAQEGLKEDALLAPDLDIRPFWCNLDSSVDQLEGFHGYLKSWKEDVDRIVATEMRAKRELATSSMTIGELFSALGWYQVVAIFLTLIGLLGTAATFGYRIGVGQWPL